MFWLNKSSFTLPELISYGEGETPTPMQEASYELSVVESTSPFTSLVLSWNADTPGGSSVQFEARVRYAAIDDEPELGEWSAWRIMGIWGSLESSLPRSDTAANVADDPIKVAVDVLELASDYQADAFQVRLILRGGAAAPVVRQLAVSTTLPAAIMAEEKDTPGDRGEIRLPVPTRSQHAEPPEIENEVCSPTSLGMVMAYHGVDHPSARVVRGVYDNGGEIYGNWPFNAAYAGSYGLQAAVRHFRSMRELEDELHAGRPVVVSIAFERGEFPESPTARTSGHLIVVTGVTSSGDFYVNDPDADPRKDQPIERVYSRANLRRAWLGHGGVAYVMRNA